ncbi:unnamed protein product [Oikopleura dioica]|uniref:b(0,+)-type amino acid transporter 1 n=1 Tax=Oikopleura dioica TaxID=34765 RepID=E4XFG3_OIKDI|nr:unnamed protein product [Oikopleura dioica]
MDSKRSSIISKASSAGGVKLQRNLTVWGGIALVVGTMIGSGIFVSPTGILKESGSVGSSLIIWVITGAISTLCALCYIELGLLVDATGAEYSYCNDAYGSLIGFLVGWTLIIMAKPAGLAVMVTAFADYTSAPFYPGCDAPEVLKKFLSICAIMFIMIVNGLSVKASERMQIIFTVVKLVLISAIIIGGFAEIAKGNTENFENAFEGTNPSISAWETVAIYNGMWSYDGWNQLNFVSQELINPERNFPLVIIGGIPLVTLLYLLVNVSYFTVMSPSELLQSPAVATTFGAKVFGSFAWIVPVGVACSTFGSSNGEAFTSARLVYAAGGNGHFPRFLAYLSNERLTPLMAVVFNAIIGILMVLPESSNIENLLDYFSFAMWTIYALTFISIIVFRYRKPYCDVERKFKIWLPLPILAAAISLYLVIAPLIEEPSLAYLLATCIIFGGLIFYIPFVYLDWNLPFGIYNKVEIFCQKYFEVVPVSAEELKTE